MTVGKKIFVNIYMKNGLNTEYKNTQNFNNKYKRTNNPIKKGEKCGQTYHKGRCKNGLKKHNFINYQGNSKYNHSEILLLHTQQNG